MQRRIQTYIGNTDFMADVVMFVYIDGVELGDGAVVVGQSLVHGLDRLAWSAPLCPKSMNTTWLLFICRWGVERASVVITSI